MSRAALRHLGLAAALTALSACSTVGPDYALPREAVYNRPAANAPFLDTGNAQVQPGAPLPARWWALYQDPMLDGLVEQALRDNVELKVASANLRRAAAVYEQALDAGGFDYEVEAGVSRAQISAEAFLQEEKLPVFNLADGKFGVSYQFDLFGKLQHGAEAAHADTQAAQAAIDLARVSVAAQVAGSYVEICNANHELHVAEHSLQLQQRSRTVTQRLISAGRGTPPDLARATAQVAMLEAALPPLRARRQAAGYALAALLGKTPANCRPGWTAARTHRRCNSRSRSATAAPCWRAARTSARPNAGWPRPPRASAWPLPSCIRTSAWAAPSAPPACWPISASRPPTPGRSAR